MVVQVSSGSLCICLSLADVAALLLLTRGEWDSQSKANLILIKV